MSAAAPPQSSQPPAPAPSGSGIAPGAAAVEACPLCGTPLQAEQEWCLSCGAAARTRLAAAPNWRGPIVAAAVIVALALGVLAAALVKLAGDTGPAPAASTHTVTTSAVAPVAPATSVPAPASTAATTPSTPATTGGAAAGTGGAAAAGKTTSTSSAAGTGSAGGLRAKQRILPSKIPRVLPKSGLKSLKVQ